eukprot:5203042-Amphidinium_carterae.1
MGYIRPDSIFRQVHKLPCILYFETSNTLKKAIIAVVVRGLVRTVSSHVTCIILFHRCHLFAHLSAGFAPGGLDSLQVWERIIRSSSNVHSTSELRELHMSLEFPGHTKPESVS